MAIMRIKEIADMTSADRAKKLVDLRAELSRLKTMVHAGGAVDNPTRIRELRKTIAQILTVENEYKLGIRKAPEEPEKKTEKKAEKPQKKPEAKKETKEKTPQ
jgi:large subunit ribosomal protein L29